MKHETKLIDVPGQHSIDNVLFGHSIDVCRQRSEAKCRIFRSLVKNVVPF